MRCVVLEQKLHTVFSRAQFLCYVCISAETMILHTNIGKIVYFGVGGLKIIRRAGSCASHCLTDITEK